MLDTSTQSSRYQSLCVWATNSLIKKALIESPDALEFSKASADASFRQYFRVVDTASNTAQQPAWIIMDAPPDKEDTGPFLNIARDWHQQGVHVPEILAVDAERGFVLMEDLGNRPFLPELRSERADKLYGDAMCALIDIQLLSTQPSASDDAELPAYDEALLRQEMSLFGDWLLDKHLGLRITTEQQTMLQTAFDGLVANAMQQPQLTVHRDYHSRNLMLTERHNPGIIDFQDAVRGPITYDLVSLLRDCYIAWPMQRVDDWALQYREQAIQAGLLDAEQHSATQFLAWFDGMGLQRHIKVAGIFARLCHRDGKSGYLGDVPLTLKYIVEVAARHPQYHALGKWVEETVIPTFTKAPQSCG